ncbi:MAG: FxsA family protein [Betaproteobacteria bacterium]|nr:FxsA family protein [Betaproteobacteria bacterium]
MRYIILGILLGFPLLEGAVIYKLAQDNPIWVIAWLLSAATVGVILIKQARFTMIERLAVALRRGEFSLAALIDSFRTVLAGLLLIFPGFISDVMACLLLLMPVREPAYGARSAGSQRPYRRMDSVIEGEFRRDN